MDTTQTTTAEKHATLGRHSKMSDDNVVEQIECLDEKPIDFLDPHRAALEDNPDKAEVPSLRTCLAVIFLALSYVCPISCGFALPTAIIIQIGTDLGDTSKISWLVGGWSIASSVSFSMAGSLSDTFGRRWTIISGQVFCLIGTIIAATAQSVQAIIVGSTFLGFGCGIIFVSYAGISELLPNKWRSIGLAMTEGAINFPFGITNVLIAASLNAHTSIKWRWCYYIGLIYCVISLVGTVLFYFPPKRPQFDHNKTRWQEFKQIDFIGIALYTAGLVTFLIGLSWAGSTGHPWRSVSVIAPLVIGFLVFVLCFVYDFTLAKQPFFPFRIFAQVRDFTVLLGIAFVAGVTFYSMSALLPEGSLYMFTNDSIQIGLIALPNGVAQFLFGAVATCFMGKIKHLKAQMIFALVLQTVFTACLAAAIPNSRAAWTALQVFSVGPFALVVLICYVTASVNIPLQYLGLAVGLIGTFRSMGGSVGNAIFNTILNGIVDNELADAISSAAISTGFNSSNLGTLIPATIDNAIGVPLAFADVPDITPAIEAAVSEAFKQVYGKAFRMVFYSTIPFGIIAIILACIMRDPSQYLTNHTAVHMENEHRSEDHAIKKGEDIAI